MKTFDEARINDIITDVYNNIEGRLCELGGSNTHIAHCIIDAEGGDFLEFGSLFGGSAIIAALIMKEYNLPGHVYAVDPFNGYYRDTKNDAGKAVGGELDCVTHLPVTVKTARKNARAFGVADRITFIQAFSYPLPNELTGKTFSVSFIDGDHWNLGPTLDWLSVKDITTKFVILDNNDGRVAIKAACEIARTTKGWEEYVKKGITYIVRRIDETV